MEILSFFKAQLLIQQLYVTKQCLFDFKTLNLLQAFLLSRVQT